MTRERASDLIGRRIKETRMRLGMTATDLAGRCADAGEPRLTAAVISNIETGRRGKDGRRQRDVTADELLALSYVLGVPPVSLMVPLNADDELAITPGVAKDPISSALWLSGDVASPDLARLVGVDDQRRITWRQSQRPIEALKDVWLYTVICMAALNAAAGTDRSQVIGQCVQRIASAADVLLAMGLTPPSLPREVAEAMRASGSLRHPDDMPVWDAEGQPDWLPPLETTAGLVEIMVRRHPGHADAGEQAVDTQSAGVLLSVLGVLARKPAGEGAA